MKKEAEAHAAEDRKRKETVEIRNQADTLISVSEKTLKDAGEKAAEADKKAAQEKVDALKAVKDKDDVEAIKKAMDELSAAIQKVGAAMYQGQNGPQGSGAGPQGGADAAGQGQGSQSGAAGTGSSGRSGSDQNGPVDAEVVQ